MKNVYREQFDPGVALRSALCNRAGFTHAVGQPFIPEGKWRKRTRKWKNSVLKRTRRLLILKESMIAKLSDLIHRT